MEGGGKVSAWKPRQSGMESYGGQLTSATMNSQGSEDWQSQSKQLEPQVSAKFQTERPPAERAENTKGCTVHLTGCLVCMTRDPRKALWGGDRMAIMEEPGS